MTENFNQKISIEQSDIPQNEKNLPNFYPKDIKNIPKEGPTEAIKEKVLKRKRKRKNQKRNDKKRKKRIKQEEQENVDSMQRFEICQQQYSYPGLNLEEFEKLIEEKANEEAKKHNQKKADEDIGNKTTENVFKLNGQQNIAKNNNAGRNTNVSSKNQQNQQVSTNTSQKVNSTFEAKDDEILDMDSRLYPPYLNCNTLAFQLAYENMNDLNYLDNAGQFHFYYHAYFGGGNAGSFKSTKECTG